MATCTGCDSCSNVEQWMTGLSRLLRSVVAAWRVWACWVGLPWLSLLPLKVLADGTQAACAQAYPEVPWQQRAAGIWTWSPPVPQDITVRNQGFVVPVSALVDGGKAWVIDPGPSLQHGQRVKDSLRCQLGAEVVGVFNTHAHAENVLANGAFGDQVAIFALEGTRAAMQERCPQCLQSLTSRVGVESMAGTRIVLPTRTLVPGQTLELGQHRLVVLQPAQGHTEADLLLWHPQSRWLWAGGLVYEQRIPELAQGRLQAWLTALDDLMRWQPNGVVSTVVAEAANGEMAALTGTRQYLHTLREQVWRAMDLGLSPLDPGWADMPAYADWAGYHERHGFNAQRAWRELEPEWMRSGSAQQVGR